MRAAPRTLLAPVSAEIAALIEALEPLRVAGGSFSASATAELAEELADWAVRARLAEAMTVILDRAVTSRLLFALSGAIEKHRGTGCTLTRAEAHLLTEALRDARAGMEGLEARLEERASLAMAPGAAVAGARIFVMRSAALGPGSPATLLPLDYPRPADGDLPNVPPGYA